MLRTEDLILSSEVTESQARSLQRRAASGELARIVPGVYTKCGVERWPELIRVHRWRLVANFFPNAVIGYATAFDPSESGVVFVNTTRARVVHLPGLTLVGFEGAPAGAGDVRLGFYALFAPSLARMFLDNLARNEKDRAVSADILRDQLHRIAITCGPQKVLAIHAEAQQLSAGLGRVREFKAFDKMVAALLGGRRALALAPVMPSLDAAMVDARRVERFDALVGSLKKLHFESIPDPAPHGEALCNFAFLESYLSNAAHGPEIDWQEARAWTLGQSPLLGPVKDAQMILGIFRQARNVVWRLQTMLSTPMAAEQVSARHEALMAYEPEARPGRLKTEPNQMGSSRFVEPEHVLGTLIYAASRLPELAPGMQRALYVMFVIAEIHPFKDGNGRLARLMMNTELSVAGECRILIPSGAKETFLSAIRTLSKRGEPGDYIQVMQEAQRWTSGFDYSAADVLRAVILGSDEWKKKPLSSVDGQADLNIVPTGTGPT